MLGGRVLGIFNGIECMIFITVIDMDSTVFGEK